MASHLPKLRSALPARTMSSNIGGPTVPSTITTRANLKRKADTIEEEQDAQQHQQPRKIIALGNNRPSRALQAANGARSVSGSSTSSSTGGGGAGGSKPGAAIPKPLTRPRAPAITARPTTRARVASAPSKPAGRGGAARGRGGVAGRPGSTRTGASSIDAELATERANLASLRSQHDQLTTQLAESHTNHRKELIGFSDEIDQLKRKHTAEVEEMQAQIAQREEETQQISEELRVCREDLERERGTTEELRGVVGRGEEKIAELEGQITDLESKNSELGAHNAELEATLAAARNRLAIHDAQMAELKQEIIEAEFMRRKLHNMVQELKGNIRVFCRVRPILPSDAPSPQGAAPSSTSPPISESLQDLGADIKYPTPESSDAPNMIQLTSTTPAFSGPPRRDTHTFTFDRVFPPQSTQKQVFQEIELLVQSVVDGYNVCVFAYGQTGSGKSWTMEGGSNEEDVGMIPRAVEQVFRVSEEMKKRGWEYTIEGEFLEIYNETIHDLLTKDASYDSSKKKHEIKHDPKTHQTRVTNLTTVPLTTPSQVHTLLSLAHSRRSVAATLVNERSSRSHSIFTLRISGAHIGFPSDDPHDIDPLTNQLKRIGGTGKKCTGCLNLVDLAGSERLNVSFAKDSLPEKERVKETQNINKSLSALGDVISALGERYEKEKKAAVVSSLNGANGGSGEGGAVVGTPTVASHVPYRNSKLTYLLQNSLSGSSKTLMFLNLSPLAVHAGESLTSLRFATKVNNTQLGPGKKAAK